MSFVDSAGGGLIGFPQMFFKVYARRYIGFDIGFSAIKAVSLRNEDGEFFLEKAFVVPISYDVLFSGDRDKLIGDLKSLRETLKIGKGEKISVAMPGNTTMVKYAKVKPSDENWVEKEIELLFPFKVSEISYDYFVYSEENGELEVLFIIAPKKAVGDLIDIFLSAGINVTRIDSPLVALSDIVIYSLPEQELEGLFVIDVGFKTTRVLYLSDGKLVYGRNIQDVGTFISENFLSQLKGVPVTKVRELEIAGKLGDLEKREAASVLCSAVLKEIELGFEDFFRLASSGFIKKILLTGGGSCNPYLLSELREKTSLSVELFELPSGLKIDADVDLNYVKEIFPRLSVCIGTVVGLL